MDSASAADVPQTSSADYDSCPSALSTHRNHELPPLRERSKFRKRPCRRQTNTFSHFENGTYPILNESQCILFDEDKQPQHHSSSSQPESSHLSQNGMIMNTTSVTKQSPSSSLPFLLAMREGGSYLDCSSGLSHRLWMTKWERQVLTQQTYHPKYVFRDYARRRIPFAALGAPLSEAVIGLDRTGSYCLTLGDVEDMPDRDNSNSDVFYVSATSANEESRSTQNCFLALRFYGLPSPCRLQQSRKNVTDDDSRSRMPLLLTVPLTGLGADNASYRMGIPYEDLVALTVRIPTVLWISSDWRLGAAWIRIPVESRQVKHSLIIFPLPGCFPSSRHRYVETLRMDDATLHFHPNVGSMKKVWWKVHVLPRLEPDGVNPFEPLNETSEVSKGPDRGSIQALDFPGYLLCTREDSSCYRLTWIRDTMSISNKQDAVSILTVRTDSNRLHPTSPHSLVTPIQSGAWHKYVSDRYTGGRHDSDGQRFSFDDRGMASASIAGEARFRCCAVLSDILQRRPKLVSTSHSYDSLPEYACDLVEVANRGVTMEMVICFDTGKRTICAVFVEIHLFTQSYREMKWTKRRCKSTGEPLETVAEMLSVNRRMSQQRIGPYNAQPEPLRDWTSLCTARSVEPDEWTELHFPERWQSASLSKTEKIPWDVIYPDVQVFDNRAVMLHTPVRSLKARSASVELVY